MVVANNAINNTVGAPISGVTNTLTVTNQSNTANSQAQEIITVGGTTAGDPFTTYTITGSTNWSSGIDNSDSQSFILSASNTLGTSNAVRVDTAGSILQTNIGSTALRYNCHNIDTSGTSTSTVSSSVVVNSTADVLMHVSVDAVANYCWGIDNSDSKKLKMNFNTVFVTPSDGNNCWTMTSAGQRTMPNQPAFYYYLSSSPTNVTGNGTVYSVPFNTKKFEQGSNFNTSTGVFTAPVAGVYLFQANIQASSLTSSFTQMLVQIVTTGASYELGTFKPSNFETVSGSSTLAVTGCVIAIMSANDTAKVTLTVSGSTQTVGVFGGQGSAWFSGCLLF